MIQRELKDARSSQDREPIVDDIIILYHTLVKDKALPTGYEKEFSSLVPVLRDAADRQLRKNAAIENEQAAVLLHVFHRQQKKSSETAKSAVEQFVAAARDRPRTYRTRLQKMLYSGPTPRKDAEEMERARWVEALSTLLRATETPMGKMLVEKPQTAQLLGAGRRVTTLRSRVRLARRYLAWLSINFEVPFPTKLEHMVDYFKVRASEPCTRGTLKNTHRSFSFLEEVAGMPRTKCVTENPLYQVLYHELLSKAAPGRATRQAPRMPVAMLRSIEQLVVNENELPYIRLYSWWTLLQNWATLRFDDHRGIEFASVKVSQLGLQARLSRSKTTGSDKTVLCRPVVVDAICYVSEPNWLQSGWTIMKQIADFERDYLMPAPSRNFRRARRMELRYDAGFAIQNRILSLTTCDGSRLIPPQLTGFWTPHSGRSFMPSCCAALQFTKDQRNYLGGWSAEGSDRYARVSVLRIRTLQGAVIKSIQAGPEGDVLGEQETLVHLQQHAESKAVPEEMMHALLRKLETWQAHQSDRPTESWVERADLNVQSCQVQDEQDEADPNPDEPVQKKRRGGNATARTEALGSNPREGRVQIRQTLPAGFYLCRAGKKRTRVLHHLGSCYALPGIDYLDYSHMGERMPNRAEYDLICRLCSRTGVQQDPERSRGTVTSSSSDEPEA